MNSIELKAYAKINLSLEVTGRRADGYHNIMSLMQGIDISDVIKITECAENGTKYNLPHCTIDGVVVYLCTDTKTIPADMSNLALKGVQAVLDRYCELYGRESVMRRLCADAGEHSGDETESVPCLVVEIEKKLMVSAGIAGGSGNGAVCMLGMDAILGYPFTLYELMEIGAAVGADVPFSLMMNAKRNAAVLSGLPGIESAAVAAWVGGIGEIVEPAKPVVRHVVLANPGIGVSTAEAYRALDELKGFSAAGENSDHQEQMQQPAAAVRRPEHKLFFNDFERYTFRAFPEAAKLRDVMKQSMSADVILMSGSGPTMIAYYTDEGKASSDYTKLRDIAEGEHGWRVWQTVTGLE